MSNVVLFPDVLVADPQSAAIDAHRDRMIAAALEYAAAGIPVFPVNPHTRIALVAWGTQHSTDPEQIRKWWMQWPIAMIATPTGKRSGLFILDLDEKGGRSGSASLADLGIDIPPEAPIVRTPSGGIHAVFAWSHNLRNTAGKIGAGIDTRAEGGIVFLAPSARSATGAPYRFEQNLSIKDFIARAKACQIPQKLLAVHPPGKEIGERPHIPSIAADVTSTYGQQRIAALVKRVEDAVEGVRQETLNSAAFELGGHVAGGEITDDDGWAALDLMKTATTLGVFEAERTAEKAYAEGMEKPLVSPARRFNMETWFEADEAVVAAPVVSDGILDGIDGPLVIRMDARAPDWVRAMNDRHAFVEHKGRVFPITENGDGSVSRTTAADLRMLYAPFPIKPASSETGRRRPDIPRYDAWESHTARRFFRGWTFDPSGRTLPGVYNRWRGYPPLIHEEDVDASGDGCKLILAHMRDVICSGNTEHFDYLIRWLAHLIQKPGEKPGVAVILQGLEGTGKDTLGYYVEKMLGPFYVNTSQEKHITGSFNSHLAACLFFHVEELGWIGKTKDKDGVLKSLITNPNHIEEGKGVDVDTGQKSFLRLFITSNEKKVVPASAEARRYFALKVSSARRKDSAYFEAIEKEQLDRGPAALRKYLEAVDLAGFNVRNCPETDALAELKAETLEGFELYWSELVDDGNAFQGEDGEPWESSPVFVEKEVFYQAYVRWCPTRRDAESKKAVSLKLAKMLGTDVKSLTEQAPASGDAKRPWCWRLPSLREIRG